MRLSAVFDMKRILIPRANKTHFHMNGLALGFVLKVRVFRTRFSTECHKTKAKLITLTCHNRCNNTENQ